MSENPECDDRRSVRWPDWDPGRLARDRVEVSAIAPDLVFLPAGSLEAPNGGWQGCIPIWPFERDRPDGLEALVPTALSLLLVYSSAHPAVAPTIYPLDPTPEINEISDTIWHVAPGQSLCLFQSEGFWIPEASITDLLLKAAGWRIEYALMHAGAIERMSEHGIVSDASFDPLMASSGIAGIDLPSESTD